MRRIKNCNVVVVGGAGFLGSHLVNHLIDDRQCKVLVVDNLVAGRREYVHKDATFAHHDIRDSEERLRQLFADFNRTGQRGFYVFNYAAYPYIPVSFTRPIHVADVNFMGAMKVINAAQDAGVEGILQVSSAEIYGDAGYVNHDYPPGTKIGESNVVRPHSSYGVAKAAVDNWVQVRWREAKTPCIALRQFNCVGERETHPYIVPEIIGQLAKQQEHITELTRRFSEAGLTNDDVQMKPVVHLGNNSFRDFMYAGDAVRIAVELLELGQFGEVFNLGSETGLKMYDLAVKIGQLMGFTSVEVVPDPARVRPYEIWHLQSDNTKIMQTISDKILRKPQLTTLDEALRKTIDWYNQNGRRWMWE